MHPVLSISDLHKSYGNVIAVDRISFAVNKGEIVGLLGPNGAGKTTVINMVLGVLAPTQGSVTIEGIDIAKQRSQALSHTNFAAVYAPLPGNLTVKENLHVFGKLYSVKDLCKRIDEVIIQFNLTAFRDTKCGVLSSGEQTRVALAKAFLSSPNLLLLDEPTASLDPATAHEARALVRKCAQGRVGVLWTSHNMLEVQEVCDRVLFMSKGKILLEGDPKTLPREYGKHTLEELFITVAREPLTLGGNNHAA
jgi:ABC-2 type transport system ATP-binding protein